MFDIFFYTGKRNIARQFFLFLGLAVDIFKKIFPVSLEEFISEARFVVVFDLVKVIHVELSGKWLYLADEAFVFAVTEVAGQHVAHEHFDVFDDKTVAGVAPHNYLCVLRHLSRTKITERME
jgi:hypothetical protein